MESGGAQKCLHTIKIGDLSENRGVNQRTIEGNVK